MNNALLSGVSGLRAHQTMIDVTGNNLANVNTMGFKSSRVTFAELLNQTVKEATNPTAALGGTNPQQVGSGVNVASIDRNMTQGSLISTGQPLDMAIEGAGFFQLSDGGKNVYTRVGALAVDSDYYLVDPATGYRMQRTGAEGVAEGFQSATSNDIRIPYDVAMPANVTSEVVYTGNLSADDDSPTTNLITSGMQYTVGGAVASATTLLEDLDQVTGAVDGTIRIQGTKRDGTNVNVLVNVDSSTTVQTLLNAITASFTGCTASINNGEIRLTDNTEGYSQTSIRSLTYTPDAGVTGTMTFPQNFQILEAGGLAVKNTNVEIYDAQGIGHVVSAAFARSGANTWDLVITSITGDVTLVDRRIKGVTFLPDGSFGGTTEASSFQMTFNSDPTNTRTINIDFGTIGGFDGVSQFGGTSTVAPNSQDGYAAGWLSTLSVTREGVLVGVFTNGIRRNVAALKLATFQNPAGLESIGGNYYVASGNSGDAVPTRALTGGAGAVHGGSLEKSNVEVANEFVNLIQAQNGFQANARTITVANDMLRELTNLIR